MEEFIVIRTDSVSCTKLSLNTHTDVGYGNTSTYSFHFTEKVTYDKKQVGNISTLYFDIHVSFVFQIMYFVFETLNSKF
jgi:hypothetical protein